MRAHRIDPSTDKLRLEVSRLVVETGKVERLYLLE